MIVRLVGHLPIGTGMGEKEREKKWKRLKSVNLLTNDYNRTKTVCLWKIKLLPYAITQTHTKPILPPNPLLAHKLIIFNVDVVAVVVVVAMFFFYK